MNIVQLTPKPRESAITILEKMLAMAKVGEITDVAIGAWGKDGCTKGWSTSDNPFTMLGVIDQLKHDYRMSEIQPFNIRE